MSPRVNTGDRRLGAAVEPPEAPGEVKAPREAPGEGPPGCTGVVSREPGEAPGEGSASNLTISRESGEALGEARPKCGFSEHPDPYMFEQELATCETKEPGNQWFGKELTGVDE